MTENETLWVPYGADGYGGIVIFGIYTSSGDAYERINEDDVRDRYSGFGVEAVRKDSRCQIFPTVGGVESVPDKETLAIFAHRLWAYWSQHIADEEMLSDSRIDRWESLWVPFEELSEGEQDTDYDLVSRFYPGYGDEKPDCMDTVTRHCVLCGTEHSVSRDRGYWHCENDDCDADIFTADGRGIERERPL